MYLRGDLPLCTKPASWRLETACKSCFAADILQVRGRLVCKEARAPQWKNQDSMLIFDAVIHSAENKLILTQDKSGAILHPLGDILMCLVLLGIPRRAEDLESHIFHRFEVMR